VLNKKYTEKCDIWSCGVVMYILLSGRPPFGGANEKKILDNVLKAPLKFPEEDWFDKSQSSQELIRLMLDRDPNKRLTASECLDHPWFKDTINSNNSESKHIGKALENLKNFRV
jgi:calcium-dependent protein kinase